MPRTDTQAVALRLNHDEHQALKAYSTVTGVSANDVIRRALREFLSGPGRQEEIDAHLQDVVERYAVALDKLADM